MKYCSKCGGRISDDVRFCPLCGSITETAVNSPMYDNASYVPTAIDVLKNLGSSPMFLSAIIAYALAALLSFFSSVSDTSGLLGAFYNIASTLDAEYMFYAYPDELYGIASVGNIISSIIGLIPVTLIFIGLLIIYNNCKSSASSLKTTGFNMLKVLTIIGMIFTFIAFFLTELIMLILLIASSSTFSGSDYTGIILLVMASSLIAVIVFIIYYVKLLRTIEAPKRVILTGQPDCRASRFVGVLCYMAAFVSFIGIFVSLTSFAYGISAITIVFGLLSSAAGACSYALFGTLIFTYRSRMKRV